jgi:hypothetical protein
VYSSRSPSARWYRVRNLFFQWCKRDRKCLVAARGGAQLLDVVAERGQDAFVVEADQVRNPLGVSGLGEGVEHCVAWIHRALGVSACLGRIAANRFDIELCLVVEAASALEAQFGKPSAVGEIVS